MAGDNHKNEANFDFLIEMPTLFNLYACKITHRHVLQLRLSFAPLSSYVYMKMSDLVLLFIFLDALD